MARYVYGPGIDNPVLMDRGGSRYWYHGDALGSIIALSNNAGNVAETYRYSPFGEVDSPSALGNPYLYTARRFDSETGLYYYRARYYSPTLRRFTAPDPIGYLAGMNLYAYVDNDPINYFDPDGTILCSVINRPCLGGLGGGEEEDFEVVAAEDPLLVLQTLPGK